MEFRATVRLTRKGEEFRYSGTAHDISEGGTGLFVAGELHPGEEIKLELMLPYSSPIEVAGVIRNRDRFEYGVQFTNVSPADRDAIVRNCRALALLG